MYLVKGFGAFFQKTFKLLIKTCNFTSLWNIIISVYKILEIARADYKTTHTKLSDEAANGDFLQHLVLGLG